MPYRIVFGIEISLTMTGVIEGARFRQYYLTWNEVDREDGELSLRDKKPFPSRESLAPMGHRRTADTEAV